MQFDGCNLQRKRSDDAHAPVLRHGRVLSPTPPPPLRRLAPLLRCAHPLRRHTIRRARTASPCAGSTTLSTRCTSSPPPIALILILSPPGVPRQAPAIRRPRPASCREQVGCARGGQGQACSADISLLPTCPASGPEALTGSHGAIAHHHTIRAGSRHRRLSSTRRERRPDFRTYACAVDIRSSSPSPLSSFAAARAWA